MKNGERKEIVVVGGGAAGFMAAIAAAEDSRRPRVTLCERGAVLRKVLASGGGRCNLTNDIASAADLAGHYPRGGPFLRQVFARFDAARTMDWFREAGLRLRVEEGGRVFPAGGAAREVTGLLVARAEKAGVVIRQGCGVTAVRRRGAVFSLATAAGDLAADAVVLASGGEPDDRPGSGYRLARSLGHQVTPLFPALAPVRIAERWPGRLAGLSLPSVEIALFHEGRRAGRLAGSLLFTHDGLSGPAALDLSSVLADFMLSAGAPAGLRMNFCPGSSHGEIEGRLALDSAEHRARSVVQMVHAFVPRSLAEEIVALATPAVGPGTRAAELSRAARRDLAGLLTACPLRATGVERRSAMVTAGGVELDEVDGRTLASRLVPGLFLCGELLNVDGFTGGYNLQAAWSTGRLAGLGAVTA